MQFRLRTFMASVAILAAALAIAVPIANWLMFDRTQHAESQLKLKGAQIIYMRDRYGRSYACVDLSGQQISDDDLEFVRELNPISELNLSGTPVGDQGLLHLAGISTLRIDLSRTQATPEGIAALKRTLPPTTELIIDEDD